jgi:ribosome modulation factor
VKTTSQKRRVKRQRLKRFFKNHWQMNIEGQEKRTEGNYQNSAIFQN